MILSGLRIILDKRLGLSVISLDPVADYLVRSIIGATLDQSPALNAGINHLIRNHQCNHCRHGLATLCKDGIKVGSLLQVARKTVKKESVHTFYSVESILYHTLDNSIRNKFSRIYESLGLLSKLATGGDFLTEQSSGRDMPEVILLCDGTSVCALAGTRRAEKNVCLHMVLIGVMCHFIT